MTTVELLLIATLLIVVSWIAFLESKIKVTEAFIAEVLTKIAEAEDELKGKNDD